MSRCAFLPLFIGGALMLYPSFKTKIRQSFSSDSSLQSGNWLHLWFILTHCPSLVCGQKCQPDKMPTGRNANQRLALCPDFLFWLAFCPSQFLVGILSGPSQDVLAFCQNHEKCRHLSECEWGFARLVDFLPYLFSSKSQFSQKPKPNDIGWAFIWSPLTQLKLFWGWY